MQIGTPSKAESGISQKLGSGLDLKGLFLGGALAGFGALDVQHLLNCLSKRFLPLSTAFVSKNLRARLLGFPQSSFKLLLRTLHTHMSLDLEMVEDFGRLGLRLRVLT